MANELTLKIGGNSAEAVAAIRQVTESMGKLAGVSVQTGAALETGAKRGADGLERLEKRAESLRGVGLRLAGALGAVAAAGALVARAGVEMNETVLRAERSLTHLGGSAERAARLVSELREEAKVTAPTFKELLPIAQQLAAAYGGDLDKVLPTIRAFGDAAKVAGANTEDMKRALLGFRQIVNSGLQGEEIRQITEALPGVDVRGILKRQFGSGDTKTLQEAKISGREIGDAIVAGMNEAFGGAQRAGADQVDVLVSGVRDQFDAIAGDLTSEFTPAVKEALRTLSDGLSELAGNKSSLEALKQPLTDLGEGLKAAASAARDGIRWFNSLTDEQKKAWVETATFNLNLGVAATGIALASPYLLNLIKHFKDLKTAINGVTFAGFLGRLGPAMIVATGLVAALEKLGFFKDENRPNPAAVLDTPEGRRMLGPEMSADRDRSQAAAFEKLRRPGADDPLGLLKLKAGLAGTDPLSRRLLEKDPITQQLMAAAAAAPSLEARKQAGLTALTPKAGVNLAGLTPEALKRLKELDAFLASRGLAGTITSARDGHSGVKSAHNAGRAIDLAIPGGNMPAIAAALRAEGFNFQFESKGQRNANGSVSTGNHLHGLLAGEGSRFDPRVAEIEAEKRRAEAEKAAKLRKDFQKLLAQIGVDALPEQTIAQQRNKDIAKLRLDEQQAKDELADRAKAAGEPVPAGKLAEIEKTFLEARRRRWAEAEKELQDLRDNASEESFRSAQQALGRALAQMERGLEQRRRLLTGLGLSEEQIEIDLQQRRVEALRSIQQRDDESRFLPGRKLPPSLREDQVEQPLFAAEQQQRSDVLKRYEEHYGQIFQEIEELGKAQDALRIAAFQAAQEAEESDYRRAAALREVTAELDAQREKYAAIAAGETGPGALRDFLQQRLASTESSIRAVQRGIGDEQDPEERADGVRTLIKLEQELQRLKQEILRVDREIAAAEGDALRAVRDQAAEVSRRRAEAEGRTQDATGELERRRAERAGPGAMAGMLAAQISETEVRIASLLAVLPVLADDAKAEVDATIAELRLKLLDLTEQQGQLRTRWQAMWRDLGQMAADGLKNTLGNALEDALMGKFDLKRTGEELRRILARSVATAATEGISAQIGRIFRRKPPKGQESASDGAADKTAGGDGENPAGKLSGIAGVVSGIKKNGAQVAVALAGITQIFTQGKSKLANVLTGLIQVLGAIPVGGGGNLLGSVIGGIASVFGFDSPVQDSRARSLGREAISKPQIGRWGFDFATAHQQGQRDGLKSILPQGAAGGQRAGESDSKSGSRPINLTVHQYNNGPINSKADVDRSYEDLGWMLQRRMRTA